MLNLLKIEDAIAKFGEMDNSILYLSDTAIWIYQYLRDSVVPEDQFDYCKYAFRYLLKLHHPEIDKMQSGFGISIFSSAADAKRNRRQTLKVGRAFRKMIPGELPDSVIEKMANAFLESNDLLSYSLTIADDRESFKLAFCGENPVSRHTSKRLEGYGVKSLANSCMNPNRSLGQNIQSILKRYDIHPAESYASGDFKIAYAQDPNGLIAARCVIQVAKAGKPIDRPNAAPIYATSERAALTIVEYLESINAGYGNWHSGARLLAIESPRDCDSYFIPYIDNGPDYADARGEYLYLSSDGEYSTQSTNGLIESENSCLCCACGAHVSAEDCYVDDNGNTYCDSCYLDNFQGCDECGESTRCEDLNEAFRESRGRYESVNVCDYCLNNNYVECVGGEYWHNDDAIYCENGDLHYAPNTIGTEYDRCEILDTIFPVSELVLTEGDGRALHRGLLVPEAWIVEDGIARRVMDPLPGFPLDVGILSELPKTESPYRPGPFEQAQEWYDTELLAAHVREIDDRAHVRRESAYLASLPRDQARRLLNPVIA